MDWEGWASKDGSEELWGEGEGQSLSLDFFPAYQVQNFVVLLLRILFVALKRWSKKNNFFYRFSGVFKII